MSNLEELEDIKKRLVVIESLLGLNTGKVSRTKVKALIKKGSNDFNNNMHTNPFPADSVDFECWQIGYKYTKELDDGH
jgi:hypothetical protein